MCETGYFCLFSICEDMKFYFYFQRIIAKMCGKLLFAAKIL